MNSRTNDEIVSDLIATTDDIWGILDNTQYKFRKAELILAELNKLHDADQTSALISPTFIREKSALLRRALGQIGIKDSGYGVLWEGKLQSGAMSALLRGNSFDGVYAQCRISATPSPGEQERLMPLDYRYLRGRIDVGDYPGGFDSVEIQTTENGYKITIW